MKKNLFHFQLITFLFVSITQLGAQPVASFTESDTSGCVPLQVSFTNTSTGSGTLSYVWDFGNGQTSTLQDPVVTYSFPDTNYTNIDTTFTVKLTVTDNNGTTFTTKTVHVQNADASFKVYYSANLTSKGYDFVRDCYSDDFIFRNKDPNHIVTSGGWNFGDNLVVGNYDTLKRYRYVAPGKDTVTLFLQTSLGCIDTAYRYLTITGPSGSFSISKPEACPNEQVTFVADSLNDVTSFQWDFKDGPQTVYYTNDTVVHHAYTSTGSIRPILYLDNNTCEITVGRDLKIRNVSASFNYVDTAFCDGYPIQFTNTSVGTNSDRWDFGDGQSSVQASPQHTYSPGKYNVSLIVGSVDGCSDTATTSFEIHPIPQLIMTSDTVVCSGNKIQLSASGGDVIQWSPAVGLDNASSYNPIASLDSTQVYTATVSDTAGNCNVSGKVKLFVQSKPELGKYVLSDTTVGVGEYVPVHIDSNVAFAYHWEPTDGLSCSNCASMVARPLTTTTYTLVVSDTNSCFKERFPLTITVQEDYHIVLPSSFTPNGDHVNDKIYVKGWGIDKLIEFKVFNRWGNQVFATDDLQQGWDGTKDGKPMGVGSYAYTVKALMLNGKIMVKKGTFNLFR